MDTREKITGAGTTAIPALGNALLVVGWFDPMQACHAAALKELAAQGLPVVVVIADPPDPILSAEARAVLAAGLSSVAAVVIARDEAEVERLRSLVPAERFTDQREEHRRMREHLARHVAARHQEVG